MINKINSKLSPVSLGMIGFLERGIGTGIKREGKQCEVGMERGKGKRDSER